MARIEGKTRTAVRLTFRLTGDQQDTVEFYETIADVAERVGDREIGAYQFIRMVPVDVTIGIEARDK